MHRPLAGRAAGTKNRWDRLVTERRRRPTYPGFLGAEYSLPDFNPDADAVVPMRRPAVAPTPGIVIPPAVAVELRRGLGRVDMDIRWMLWLDQRDVLRLWRSWTGYEIYRAETEPDGESLRVRQLEVETDPERYSGNLNDEPRAFAEIYRAQLRLLGVQA